MIKVGITGGIGSGKSVVAELMQVMGIPVYNADNKSKKILETNPRIQDKLKKLLGDDIFRDGILNKPLMASLIFNNPELLSHTNSIIHPAVLQDFEAWSNTQTSAIVACESALVFESGINRLLNSVITVSAPLELRIKRATSRDNADENQIRNRIKNQMPEEEKAKRSDFVLVNDGEKAIIPQLHRILEAINHSVSNKNRDSISKV